MKRNIYEKLIDWKNNNINTPLMILGARQIGKTYIIKQFCENEFENFIYINLLENKEIIDIYKENINSDEKFLKLEYSLGRKISLEKTIIFFDEIQESEELISSLKYFCEDKRPFKIICAGSLLGVKINRFHSSFPVGKVRMITMYPMNFEEFLRAIDYEIIIPEIKKCYQSNKPMNDALHEKLLTYYRMFICTGGMPEAVQDIASHKEILTFDKSILDNIIDAYLNDMKKYVVNNSESPKIESIYKSIPAQLGNPSHKFQYNKINKNARARDYISALSWLLSSKMVIKCSLVDKVEIPLKAFENESDFKLYLSDVGLLTTLLEINYSDIMLDKSFMYKGIIAENYVATELIQKNKSLHYWKSNNTAEIDFLLYNEDGIIPIEVKAATNNNSKSLKYYMEKYNPPYAIRISSKNFGFENNIKSIPLYATYLIN